MDDTVEHLTKAWVEYLNKRYGTSVQHSDIVDWDISQSFPTLTRDQVYGPLIEDEFWLDIEPIDGASDTLQKLIADGHRVLIVTASDYRTLRVKMDEVLFKHFPFLTWSDVIVTVHKQLVKGDVLVDDGIHNLVDGDYVKLLMSAPYNMGYDARRNGMLRVKTWEEIYGAISMLAEMTG